MAEHEPSIGATSEWFTPPEYFEGLRTSLGSANRVKHLYRTRAICFCISPTFLQKPH